MHNAVKNIFSIAFSLWFLIYFSPRSVLAAPQITQIQENLSTYPNNAIPKHSKFEVTFSLSTVAQNMFYPFDPIPPSGLEEGIGVSVDARFVAPDGNVFKQPAFYYQVFDDEIKANQEWFYPTGTFAWKVRFSPHLTGTWKYSLVAQDSSGDIESSVMEFNVIPSENHGFIKVSKDPRYFEYQDGTYFPSLGFNLNGGELDNTNPVLGNTEEFTTMSRNGIQLSRIWVSQFSIFGEAWANWGSNNRAHMLQEPRTGIVAPNNYQFAQYYPDFSPPQSVSGSEYYMWLEHNTLVSADGQQQRFTPCRFVSSIPVRQNTTYKVRVRYQEKDIEGPKVAGHSYGFAIKTTDEFWGSSDRCNDWDAGSIIAANYNQSQVQDDVANPGWKYLTGTITSTNKDFIKYLYLTFDNTGSIDGDTKAGHVFIDQIWLEEANCQNNCANHITKPNMSMHQYINQRSAYSFDKVLNLAEQNGMYLKAVMNEKNDRILQSIGFDGNTVTAPSINNFYGNRRSVSKVRWLQQAWWRYMQARWGYSANIHSWELLNEGHPGNGEGHWDLADEFGKYMKCRVFGVAVSSANPYEKCLYKHPNSHLVSTSFYGGSFPWQFWNNQQSGTNLTFTEMDYADQHYYAVSSDTSPLASFYDSAQFSYNLSAMDSNFASGKRKPFMRGEVAWDFGTSLASRDLFADNSDSGEWLHDFIWAGVNYGGLIEHFFAGGNLTKQIYNLSGNTPHDHRPMFKIYYDFIKDIPLNSGNYQNLQVSASNTSLRVWGQQDLVNNLAHLWIANKKHTWYNAIGGYSGGPTAETIAPITAEITLSGFIANTAYPIAWLNTYTGQTTTDGVQPNGTIISDSSGNLHLNVNNLISDVAVKIGSYDNNQNLPADLDYDSDVDLDDFAIFLENFGTSNNLCDFNNSGIVDIFDYNIFIDSYFKR